MTQRLSDRQFFVHSAHRRIGVAVGATPKASGPAAAVALVAGSAEEGWPWAASLLAEQLDADGRFECCQPLELAWANTAELAEWDCLVLLGRPDSYDAEVLRRLEEHCRRGGSVVALGSAREAFDGWPKFAEDVLGLARVNALKEDARSAETFVDIVPIEAACDHPVLAGVEPFVVRADLPSRPQLHPRATIVLQARAGQLSVPVAWTHLHQGGRVFYLSLASAGDFQQPEFLRLLSNAIGWAAGAGLA